MPTTIQRPRPRSRPAPERTASQTQRRKGVRLLVISVPFAAAMFALWWLVATTNREGHHDAELLPIFTLFTLVPAVYHLLRARYLRSKGR
jgi:hypothetical protein